MAEYQEVMHHLGRMCGTYLDCTDGCPLQEEPNVCFLAAKSLSTEKIKATEQAIMSWAAEHPEPVYPLWFEWLEKIGVAGRAYDLEPYFMGDKEILQRTAAFTVKAFEPIPTDIAQKLGIEPKEVT